MNHSHFNLANAVTCLRFALVPFFLYAAWVDMRLAMLIFFIAAASDWLDGYLARRLRCHSALGALLDPLADKCMSWAALLVINLYLQQFMLACASLCIVLRDLYLSAQRLYYFTDNRYAPALQVSPLAKIKTALLFFSQLLLTFYIYAQNELVYSIGIVLLYASCLLTLISFGRYLRPKRI